MHIHKRVVAVIHSQKLMAAGDKVIVAVSGGSDSLALLHILKGIDLQLELRAIYIDHGLRPFESPAELDCTRKCCLSLQVPFTSRTVDVNSYVKRHKTSVEEAARILRYGQLEQARIEWGARCIAIAHTADDQVEEFFIRLIRGSSRKSLSGMRTKRDHIIRPLLFERKVELQAYLSELSISWCFDSSNRNRQYLRNRVRLDLLPLLEADFNPSIRKTILQHMDLLATEDDFLEKQTEESYQKCVLYEERSAEHIILPNLSIKQELFLENHPAIRRRILEKCCWQLHIRPSHELICRLEECIATGKTGTELHLEDGVRAEKHVDILLLDRPLPTGIIRGSKRVAAPIDTVLNSTGRYTDFGIKRELILTELTRTPANQKEDGELLIDLDKISFPLRLRSYLPGEKFYPYGSPGRKKISRYFNERKIPKKERPAWPVLLSGDNVVAVVGLQLDQEFQLTESTQRILSILWRKTEK